MTLGYIRAIAEYCDRKFEFKHRVYNNFSLNDIRKELAMADKVLGSSIHFCSLLMLQLRRDDIKSKIWKVVDFNKEFYVLEVCEYFVSYYDGRIYLSHECPWKKQKYTTNLINWVEI